MPYLEGETEGQTQSDNGESGLAKGAIAGIVIGSIAGLLVIAVSLIIYLRRRKSGRHRSSRNQISHSINLWNLTGKGRERPSARLSNDVSPQSK